MARAHLHLHGDDAAQRIGEAGQAGLDVLGVADDDDVGLQAGLVFAEERQQVTRADFFLALDQHLDVDGQLAVRFEEGGDGGELGGDGPLVVGAAPAKQPAIAARQLPGRRLPLLEEVNRLHVVMGVEEDRRFAGRAQPLAVGIGVGIAGLQ